MVFKILVCVIMLCCSCWANGSLIIPGVSLGPYKLGDHGKSSLVNGKLVLTEDAVRVETFHNSRIFRIYSESKEFHFQDGFVPVGKSFAVLTRKFGPPPKKEKSNFFAANSILITYEGLAFVDRDQTVIGVGIWSKDPSIYRKNK